MQAYAKLARGVMVASAKVGGFKGVIAKVGAAIGGISAPVLIIVGVIAALTAAFVYLWKTNEGFRNRIIAIWNQIKEVFSNFTQGIVDRLNALGFDFENFTEVVKAVWDAFCSLLAPVFEGAFKIIASVLETVLGVITGILDIFIGIFTGNWEQAWTGVKEIFSSIWNGIKGVFEAVIGAIRGIADTILGWFGTSWNEVWTGIKDFFTQPSILKTKAQKYLSDVQYENLCLTCKAVDLNMVDGDIERIKLGDSIRVKAHAH